MCTDFDYALANQQFTVYYQPRMDLRRQTIVGAEALLRWQHPERGLLLPHQFIPQAESSGFIVPLGEWVLRAAVKQQRVWMEAGTPLCMAVNLAPQQLDVPTFATSVKEILHDQQVSPTCLELELTETQALAHFSKAYATMTTLQQDGVRFAMDDFGIGYSTLERMRAIPFDTIKLDRTFIQGLTTNRTDRAIARMTIQLGRTLQQRVVAEGVEDIRQVRLLERWGCDEIQGFYLGQPAPAREFKQRFLR